MVIISKTITTRLNLTKSNEIYPSNKTNVVTDILEKKFINKCFQNILIKKILSIIAMSPIMIMNNDLKGSAYCDVVFTVEGNYYIPGEIVPGWKITKISDSIITAVNNSMIGSVEGDRNDLQIKVLGLSNEYPFTIKDCMYNPFSDKITATITPIKLISKKLNIYYVTDVLSEDNNEELKQLINEYNELEDIYFNLPSDRFNLFNSTLYPFKSLNTKFEDIPLYKKCKKLSLDNLSSINSGMSIVSPIEDYNKKELCIYYIDSKVESTEKASLLKIMIRILTHRMLYMRNIITLCEYYENPNEVKKINTYWVALNTSKQ